MIRVLGMLLVAAALDGQHTVKAQQCMSCPCNPVLYNELPIAPPTENEIVPRRPRHRCRCGCRNSPQRVDTGSHAVAALSGFAMDSRTFQQTGPATIIPMPKVIYWPKEQEILSDINLQTPPNSPPSCDCGPPSHIMTIPRKNNPLTESLSETINYEAPPSTIISNNADVPSVEYSSAPKFSGSTSSFSSNTNIPTCSNVEHQDSSFSPPFSSPEFQAAPSSLPPQLQRPFFFTQSAPVIASCPATIFYHANPAVSYSQPNVMYPEAAVQPFTTTQPVQSCPINQPVQSFPTTQPVQSFPTTQPLQPLPATQPLQSFPTNSSPVPGSSLTFTSGAFKAPTERKVPSQSEINAAAEVVVAAADFSKPSDDTMSSSPTTNSNNIDSPLTYKLLTSSTKDSLPDLNRDCSVPLAPSLV